MWQSGNLTAVSHQNRVFLNIWYFLLLKAMVTLISEYDFHEKESEADFGLRGACQSFAQECFKTTSKIQSNFRHLMLGYMLKSHFLFALCMKSTRSVPLSKKQFSRIFSGLFPGLGFFFFRIRKIYMNLKIFRNNHFYHDLQCQTDKWWELERICMKNNNKFDWKELSTLGNSLVNLGLLQLNAECCLCRLKNRTGYLYEAMFC